MYIYAPNSKYVTLYPNKDNVGKVTYIDDNRVCYRYKKVLLNQ